MKRCLLAAIVLFALSFSHAQNKAVDSLQKVLGRQKEDTNKVNTLIELSRQLREADDAKKALEFSQPALEISEKLHFIRGKAKAYQEMGLGNLYLNRKLSLQYHQLSLQFFEQIGDKRSIAYATLYVGSRQLDLHNSSEASRYESKALSQFTALNDKQGMAETYQELNFLSKSQNNLSASFRYVHLALRIYEELGNVKGQAACFNSIASVYILQQNDAEALNYYLQAFALWEKSGEKFETGRLCNNIGNIYLRQGKYDKALERYQRALRLSGEVKSVPWLLPYTQDCLGQYYERVAEVAERTGDTARASEKYKEALSYYFQSLSYWKAPGKPAPARFYLAFGRIYTKQNKYALARNYLDSALYMYQDLKNLFGLSETNKSLCLLDSLQGDFRQALRHYVKAMIYFDSVESDSKITETTQIRMQYEFDKTKDSLKTQQLLTNQKLKEQQLLSTQQRQRLQIETASLALSNQQKELNRLAYLQTEAQLRTEQSERQQREKQLSLAEKERALQQANLKVKTTQLQLKGKEVAAKSKERNLIIVGSFACLLLGAAFWRSQWQKQKAYALLEKQKLRTAISSDLHDEVGSALSAISIFSEMAKQSNHDAKQGEKYLQRIGDRSRESIEKMGDIIWSINPENDNLQQILLRMKTYASEVADAKGTAVHWQEDERLASINLNMTERKNFYLLFKEGFNNAIKYSCAQNIYVNLKAAQSTVSLCIKDDGLGFDVANTPPGNGLKTLQRRATLLGGQLKIESAPGKGTALLFSFMR